jgi:hypothetical protein
VGATQGVDRHTRDITEAMARPPYSRVVVDNGRGPELSLKGLSSLNLLVVWAIWQEQNARIFHHKLAPSFIIVDKIKSEARLWVLAGVKKLGDFMPGE